MPNAISEWYGHRVSPVVTGGKIAQTDQTNCVCPFLTGALARGENQSCIKPANSQGVCTVGSDSNGVLQDWVVCPYRTISSPLFGHLTGRLFANDPKAKLTLLPASAVTKESVRHSVFRKLKAGEPVYLFFLDKLGGEIDLPGSDRSPKFKLDATVIELHPGNASSPRLGRYAVIEIQTMDFHGSYRSATANLRDALRLHKSSFATQLTRHPEWAAKDIEGPNIANVFKRTIYQILFKLRLGRQPDCAGCVLALPQAVWDSWQPHLGAPKFTQLKDGTWRLGANVEPPPDAKSPGWLCVFDIDSRSKVTPNPIVVRAEFQLDVASLSHLAFEKAPEEAMLAIGGDAGLKTIIRRRLAGLWPDAFSL